MSTEDLPWTSPKAAIREDHEERFPRPRALHVCDECGDGIVGDVADGAPCAREDESSPTGMCRGHYETERRQR